MKREYIREKVIDLRLGTAVAEFDCPGHHSQTLRYSVKLIVDTDSTDLGALLEYLMTHYPVVDVNISNPLEQIIMDPTSVRTASLFFLNCKGGNL